MKLAPIVLFVYNRPVHTTKTINCLAANMLAGESDLYIYADGKKNVEDVEVQQVREIINKIEGFKTVTVFEREYNVGLAANIIEGVTNIFSIHEKMIVMEDDLITSKYFLTFMNQALEKYSNHSNIGMIHGHIYNIPSLPENFFMYKAGCWGWGTWKHVWAEIEFDGKKLLKRLDRKDLVAKFNINNAYPYTQMLKDQIAGKNNSWAIRVYASLLLTNKLTFYPGKSLVQHIGFDAGTHYANQQATDMDGILSGNKIEVTDVPVVNNDEVIQKLNHFYLRFGQQMPRGATLPKFIKTKYFHFFSNGKLISKINASWKQFIRGLLISEQPLARDFGLSRGKPIDRFYIEQFLSKHANLISGNILEVGDDVYSKKYATVKSTIKTLQYHNDLNYENETCGDLTNKHTLPEAVIDCFICTQTLNFIYDFNAAIKGIKYLLSKKGAALVTVASICKVSKYDADRWGDFWRFNPQGIKKAFVDVFGENNVEVFAYGNYPAARYLLDGLATQDINIKHLQKTDEEYPVLIGIIAYNDK
jgi:hypothetical protein